MPPPKKKILQAFFFSPPTRKLAARSLKLVEWAKLWRMAFNPSMCYVLLVFRTKCPFIHPYTMLGHTLQDVGHTLQAVDHYPYLGVSLSENLNWKPHIVNITNKANSTLGFIKRNLLHCPQKVKGQAYKSLVRPRLENGLPLSIYCIFYFYVSQQKCFSFQSGACEYVCYRCCKMIYVNVNVNLSNKKTQFGLTFYFGLPFRQRNGTFTM